MGNRIDDKNNDEFLKAVHQMRKSRNQFAVQKVSTHLQERYKELLIQSLKKQEMSKTIKKLLADCIQKKIRKEDLTSVIAVLNSLRSNNAQQLLKTSIAPTKAADQSKNVVVKYDQKKSKFRRVSSDSSSKSTGSSYMWFREQDTLEGRIKYTGQFICKQFNKPYHPFRILCKRFTDIINTYQSTQNNTSANDKQYDAKQQMQRKTVKDFCAFMVAGCVGIYRKWIIQYTGLEDKKYQKWMYSLVLNQIWTVNEASMLSTMLRIIKKAKVPLKINFQLLSSFTAMGFIHPKDFSIDPQFQIQGHYFTSIFTMSTLTQKTKPIQMLKQLQNIHKSICLDIDNYHKLQETGKMYEINADNIMGIVAYILVKNTNKIQQISTILLFLKMIYGEGIFYNMDISSYMYSTIWSAIQYIQTRKFQLPKQNQNYVQVQSGMIEKQLKDTKCAQSSSFVSHKSSNNNNFDNKSS